ncbi:MAG: tetratricopeptide repeat protein [Gemmatimonadales bacterium]
MIAAAPALTDFDRGLAAQRSGDTSGAIAAYQRTIASDPRHAAAHFNLGHLLRNQKDLAGAAAAFEAAAQLRPSAADAWLHLGVSREGLGDLDRAIAAYRRAIDLGGNGRATALFNAGNVLRKQGALVAAATAFADAAQTAPEAADVWLNLGNVQRELGRLPEARTSLERAIELKPDWAEAKWNLGLVQLASGRLAEGWSGYAHRWARAGLPGPAALPWATWQGEPLEAKQILVWGEQGVGDEILFATCVPDLVEAGASVTLAVDPRLVGLYARSFPAIDVVAHGEWGAKAFDFQAPLGDLPGRLRASRAAFRPRWSHLVPAPSQIANWTERLRSLNGPLRVGLCWRSGLNTGERRRYYPTLLDLSPVLQVPGVEFVNLQYDDCRAELEQVEAQLGVRIHRWPGIDLKHDLESVAALIWHLDLVITAPTAVSSLAGAVGTETWQLDAGTDWTLFGEQRSPWLPAIRAFAREYGTNDWGPVSRRLEQELTIRRSRETATSVTGRA